MEALRIFQFVLLRKSIYFGMQLKPINSLWGRNIDRWLTGGVQRARAQQDVDAALGEHLTVLVADAKRRILLLEASQHRGQAALVVQVIRVS